MYQYVSLFQMFESRIFVGFYTKLHLVLRALHRCTVAPIRWPQPRPRPCASPSNWGRCLSGEVPGLPVADVMDVNGIH